MLGKKRNGLCTTFQNRLPLFVGTGITVYALHPGLVRTELGRCVVPYFDTTIGYNLFHYLTWPLMKEPWNGAQTTVCCAVDESLANESGKYYRCTLLSVFKNQYLNSML